MTLRQQLGYVAAATTAIVLASAGSAYAVPTATINGVTFPTGIVAGGNTLQSGILDETLVTAVGQTLTGIGRVDTINDASNNIIWSTGTNGVQLAFTFTNYTVSSITAPSALPGQVTFTGGTLSFYTLPTSTIINDPTKTVAQNVATITSGTLFLSETGAPEDQLGHTLVATIPTGTLQNFNAASGFGFLDVSGGPAASYFNTNTFADSFDTNGGLADQSFTSDFSTGASGAFPVSGSATLKANATTPTPAPEPASVAMLAMGLLGLTMLRRTGRG